MPLDEVRAIRHGQAIAAQQPLVELDLPLVCRLPLGIERNGGHAARGLVVDHLEGAAGIPHRSSCGWPVANCLRETARS